MSILWKPDLSDTRPPLVRISFRIFKIRLGCLLSRLLRASDHETLNDLSPVAVLAKAFQGVTPSTFQIISSRYNIHFCEVVTA